jgi:NADH:ubiquinone oxidoreductase subunit E
MSSKIKLIICLGSSCYSRGNQDTLEAIKSYLNQHKLKDRVDFRGHLCSGDCANGPIMRFNDKKYEHIDAVKAIKILDRHFFPKVSTSQAS